jgi:hypothetical protein
VYMESYINLASQILFLLAAIIFVVYSVVGIYTLNIYGRSKSAVMAASIVYGGVVIALLGWGWVTLGTAQ